MVWTFSGCSACWGSAPGSRMACRATLLPERMNSYLSDCHLHRGFASWQTMLNASHSLSCREATVYNNVCAFARLNVISVLSRHIVFFLLLGRHFKNIYRICSSLPRSDVLLFALWETVILLSGRLLYYTSLRSLSSVPQEIAQKLKNALFAHVCMVDMKLQPAEQT